ncbi:BH3-interacting domain death agonist isoform X2 [Molossus molossus]|uniref:BH3-interacting domain death agonist isoform X2 n=1 Tax=Molossus molossus TaxID=27622 RepID=UPI0017464445|nr:BH3-interacting domain death agonist isoform X2 [Molossus molossus]
MWFFHIPSPPIWGAWRLCLGRTLLGPSLCHLGLGSPLEVTSGRVRSQRLPGTSVSRIQWGPSCCAMDPKVSNGSGLQDEYIANLLVFGFLQNCSSCGFRRDLQALGCDLRARRGHEDELQTDELQTDGSRHSRLLPEGSETDSESQEEAIRSIARQLALIGDRMDHSIPPTLVQQLVVQFMNRNLSEEDRREHLAAALQQVMQTYPRDVEEEKIMLTLTMLLAKKVADHTPSLLRDVFRTTVNFINQNLLTCVRNLVRNEVD